MRSDLNPELKSAPAPETAIHVETPVSDSHSEPVVKLPSLTMGPAGMRMVVEENHDLPIVRVTFTLLIGAADDPPGREGLASFASELACRGAGGRSREAIDEALESLGADFGAGADADSVSFELGVLSAHLPAALAIVCDVLLRPDFPEEEAEKLRREMLAGLDDLRDEDNALVRRFFSRRLYAGLPYGQPPGGTAQSIPRLTASEARRFMERALAGGTLIVGVAGDVDEGAFRDLIGRRLGSLRLEGPQSRPLPTAPFPGGPRLLLIDKPERTQSQLLFGHPAIRRADPDFVPLSIATTAFGGTFTARLMREVRVKRGLSYGASCSVSQGRGPRAVTMSMAPSLDQTVETIALALDLWRDFVENGLTDEEVTFAKDYLSSSFAFQLATPEDRVDLRLGVELCGLPADFLETLVPRIREVTPEKVREVMARVLRPTDLLVAAVSTAKDLLPRIQKAKLFPKSAIEVVDYESY